MIDNILLII